MAQSGVVSPGNLEAKSHLLWSDLYEDDSESMSHRPWHSFTKQFLSYTWPKNFLTAYIYN